MSSEHQSERVDGEGSFPSTDTASAGTGSAETERVAQARRREPTPNELSEEVVEEIAEDAEDRARP